MPPFDKPLQVHAVDGDVIVSDPDGGSDVWITPEAALDSVPPLRRAAEEALRQQASASDPSSPAEDGED